MFYSIFGAYVTHFSLLTSNTTNSLTRLPYASSPLHCYLTAGYKSLELTEVIERVHAAKGVPIVCLSDAEDEPLPPGQESTQDKQSLGDRVRTLMEQTSFVDIDLEGAQDLVAVVVNPI